MELEAGPRPRSAYAEAGVIDPAFAAAASAQAEVRAEIHYDIQMAAKAPDDPIPKRFRAAVNEIYRDRVARVVLYGSRAR